MSRRISACAAALAIAGSASAADGPFALSSPDLPEGQPIAERFTANVWGCHGANESPALAWTHAPAGTKSFAVTLFDPATPPLKGWWHWVIYDIPATANGLPRKAGDPNSPALSRGMKQVRPDGPAPEPHYYGPCPDEGDAPHRYTFTVYALSVDHLDLPATATLNTVDFVIFSKMLAKASLVRPFARQKQSH